MVKKSSATTAAQESTAAESAGVAATAAVTVTGELLYIPVNRIIVEKQIRTGAGINNEASPGLKDSIAAKGVLEPILVTPREDMFLLLAGELRYRACLDLGLETIPARVLPNVQPGEEVLTIQLIENLQRQELDPIDKASAILSFISARHADMDLDKIINGLMSLRRDETRVETEFAQTVCAIEKISGVARGSMYNILSLLKLPQAISDSVKSGAIAVSQGYILAANLDNPALMFLFESILKNPVTNKRLTELLKKADQTDAETPADSPSPFQPVYTAAQALTKRLEEGKVHYDVIELENLRLFFLSMAELLERAKVGGGTLKEPDPPPGSKKKIIA